MSHATRSISSDYLQGIPSLRPFYQYPIATPDFGAVMADKGRETIDRQLLAQVIASQYEGLDPGPAVLRNIARLAQPDSYTVTTGHQLVLFGGPMFTVYKVLHTLVLAAALEARHPGATIVPVFWIHTEDHDHEEINHYYSSYAQRHTYDGRFGTQVGSHVLDASIGALIPAHFPAELRETYRPGRSMAQAFRHFMHLLFGRYGLLILDASHPDLKAQFRAVMRRELREGLARDAVGQTSASMAEAGYPLQIQPRPINLFYLDEVGRNRIERQADHYQVVDRGLRFSPEEMEQLLTEQPARFSPNVSLRPLYQERILPNLAYLGGWGELAYWFQLRSLFDHTGVNFPMLLPRFSATLFEPAQGSRWAALGFAPADIRRPLHELHQLYLPQVWDDSDLLARQARILEEIAHLTTYIDTQLSPTLARSADALHTKARRYLDNLHAKARRVIRHHHAAPFREIEALKLAIQPDGLVQERVLGLAAFADHNPYELVDFIRQQIDPLDYSHKFIALPAQD
ncbi:MAG: bacillithiol biosynthesis cysteine-adding enzyme BshC [Bacteroidia bacterium]